MILTEQAQFFCEIAPLIRKINGANTFLPPPISCLGGVVTPLWLY